MAQQLVIVQQEVIESLQTQLNVLTQLVKESRQQENRYISVQEFTKMLGISTRTAQTWRDKGLISCIPIEGKMFYQYSDIVEFMERNKRHAFNPKGGKLC